MPGLLNGQDPDSRDLALAPHLGALAALDAVGRVAHLALLAAHPEPRRKHPPPDSLQRAADDAITAISELRAYLRRYANRLGADVLWAAHTNPRPTRRG